MKYPGSKWSIAETIVHTFPEHHSYLEPFFGSGAVFFTKPESRIETINDIDGDVVNLFKCMRDYPEELASKVAFTPYSRQIYEEAHSNQKKKNIAPVDRALNFLIRLDMGFGFRTNGSKVGWKRDIQGREAAYAAKYWVDTPWVIRKVAKRLSGVQIECLDAVKLIRDYNYPNVLIYADPPYLKETRSCRRDQYMFEMTDEDHERLLKALLKHRGPVCISGYPSDMYEDYLHNWIHLELSSLAQNSTRRREMLWMNYEPTNGGSNEKPDYS